MTCLKVHGCSPQQRGCRIDCSSRCILPPAWTMTTMTKKKTLLTPPPHPNTPSLTVRRAVLFLYAHINQQDRRRLTGLQERTTTTLKPPCVVLDGKENRQGGPRQRTVLGIIILCTNKRVLGREEREDRDNGISAWVVGGWWIAVLSSDWSSGLRWWPDPCLLIGAQGCGEDRTLSSDCCSGSQQPMESPPV